jgi:hypothetical protein
MTREHDDFNQRAPLLDHLQGGDTVHNRHLEIEKDDLDAVGSLESLQCVQSARNGDRGKPSLPEPLRNDITEQTFIVHYQYDG